MEQGTITATAAAPVGPWRAAVGRVLDHPLLTVAAVAAMVAIGQGIWIWTHRSLGALVPDEAGYVATAIRYERLLTSQPLSLPRAIGGTASGPLVPLLSVPLLLVGPFDARTVLLMQPILGVVCAVAVGGIAHRLAGPAAAIVAGLAFIALPTVVFASQTYWLGLGAATFLALAFWALLASERLTNRWAYAFGACAGAMLLCRTMTLGYVPAVAVAAVVVAGRDRRSWVGVAKAAGAAAVVAAPWWIAARSAIFSYLFSYGYGDRAALFGEGGPLTRLGHRLGSVWLGVGAGEVWVLFVVACSLGVMVQRWDGWPPATRSAAAVGAAAALGLAALVSTSNNGVWFELPVIALLVPLAVAAGAQAPVPVRAVSGVAVAAVSVLQLACSWWLIAPGTGSVPGVAQIQRVSQYEYGFAQYDTRLGPDHRDQAGAAAREWQALSVAVERELRRRDPQGQGEITMSGNFELFNSNTVQLAGELRHWTPRISVPDTVGGTARRAPTIAPPPRRPGVPDGVLLVALHDQHLFTPDAQVSQLYREARRAGWVRAWSRPMPGGGEVVLLRYQGSR